MVCFELLDMSLSLSLTFLLLKTCIYSSNNDMRCAAILMVMASTLMFGSQSDVIALILIPIFIVSLEPHIIFICFTFTSNNGSTVETDGCILV